MDTDKSTPKQGTVNVHSTLIEHSIATQAMLKVLLNAVGELTAHLQEKDAMQVKTSLHERVEKARKQITNTTFGYPADYEGELIVKN